MIKVEIDEGSGFCFGVVTAIHKAEEELAKGETPLLPGRYCTQQPGGRKAEGNGTDYDQP